MKPPPLPEATLVRVLRIARFNGLSVLVIASLGALVSLAFGDLVGTAVGIIVAYGGWVETAGRRQLVRGDADGMTRLVRAQWIVAGAIIVYCARQLASFDLDTALGGLTPGMRQQLSELGVDLAPLMPLVRMVFYTTYSVVAVLTLLYQGGMARYYRRRTEAVKQALAARLRPKPPATSASSGAGRAPEDFLT